MASYYEVQLDNGATFDGFTLPEVQEKVTEYYLDMERDRCPEAALITHHHDDDETYLGVAKTAAFNATLADIYLEKVVNSHYQEQHDRGTAQMTGRL